jgi:hypothetical protein
MRHEYESTLSKEVPGIRSKTGDNLGCVGRQEFVDSPIVHAYILVGAFEKTIPQQKQNGTLDNQYADGECSDVEQYCLAFTMGLIPKNDFSIQNIAKYAGRRGRDNIRDNQRQPDYMS